jgi:putative transposase
VYYTPKVNEADLAAMDAIDRLFTKYPFYGVLRMQAALRREADITIGRDHTRRLMRLMGLEAIYPKPRKNTSILDKQHAVYPYLLNGVIADHPNHIWGSDITYIRLEHGWCYLYAIIDWYSRFVVAWELSASMETDFCIRALRNAIEQYGIPEISNTDQGSQFTDREFIDVLKENDIRISMDGRGRCMDNIFTERLWRTVKYEEVYLKSYADIPDAQTNLAAYFRFYGEERPHQALRYHTPAEMYLKTKKEKSSTKIDTVAGILDSTWT